MKCSRNLIYRCGREGEERGQFMEMGLLSRGYGIRFIEGESSKLPMRITFPLAAGNRVFLNLVFF